MKDRHRLDCQKAELLEVAAEEEARAGLAAYELLELGDAKRDTASAADRRAWVMNELRDSRERSQRLRRFADVYDAD